MSDTAVLSETLALAAPIVDRIVWATVSTVGPTGEPRSRIMHPVWDWSAEVPTALVTARRSPVKTRHLAGNNRVACLYWDPSHDVVTIDATASWLDPDEHGDAWNRIRSTPPPVGFDPAMIWPDGPASEGVGFLRFTARRIVATPVGQARLLWRAP